MRYRALQDEDRAAHARPSPDARGLASATSFGGLRRYVSPEVAQAFWSRRRLRSEAEAHRDVLMSDLPLYALRRARRSGHGYGVLNGFWVGLTDIIIEPGAPSTSLSVTRSLRSSRPVEHLDNRSGRCLRAHHAARHGPTSIRNHATKGQPQFEMGIGLNTGEAVVGNIAPAGAPSTP